MRQFPSNGGVLDASELDPCLAAESRMKQSFVSSKMKKLIIILGVLCLLLLLVGVFFFFLGKSDDSIDYEEHEVQTDALIDDGPSEEINVKQTEAPYFVTDAPTPTPRYRHRPVVSSYETYSEVVVERRPVLKMVDILTTTPGPTTPSSTTPAPTTQSTTTTRSTSTTPRPTPAREPTTASPQPTVSVRVSYMQVEPSVIPLTDVSLRDCMEHREAGYGSGIYVINPDGGEPFHVFCDMETDGGGWTVIQRRLDGEVPFYNYTYQEYEEGFGQLRGSHWLGLEYMHRLAPAGYEPLTLRIELRGDTCPTCSKQADGFWWGEWDFALGPAKKYYPLEISEAQLRGNMSIPDKQGKGRWEKDSNGRPFTTMDVDNDEKDGASCAQFRSLGGWWHRDCTWLALNGRWGDHESKLRYLVYLYAAPRHPKATVADYYIHPRQTLMMLRPRL